MQIGVVEALLQGFGFADKLKWSRCQQETPRAIRNNVLELINDFSDFQ